MNLAISTFTICFLLACSSIKQSIKKEKQIIFDLEIESHKDFTQNDKVIFHYLSNDYLIDSLNDKAVISNHFSNEDTIYFLEQLENKTNKKYSIPKNFYVKNDVEISIDEILEVKRVNISNPIISKNAEIALIAYSYGHKNSLEGGIKIYHKIDGKWKYYDSFNLWIG
ncbi:hypothetical protein [Winogradskyella sp. PC D3.3]